MALSERVQAAKEERARRIEDATREAYLKLIIRAFNVWIADPMNASKVQKLSAAKRGYRKAVETGLFPLSGTPALSRHGSGDVTEKELKAAMELLREVEKGPEESKLEKDDSPPW